ncbi:MAG: tetratricopeptide repeat protein, partial [Flavobacteriales bacterium]|nr:tetratricopeptide repeat protein [Flavobacteriales bacterium]
LIDSSKKLLYTDNVLSECYAQKALGLASLKKDSSGISKANKALGDVFLIGQDYFRAKQQYSLAEVQLLQLGAYDKAALCRNNLGIVYRELGMFDEAISVYLKNIKFFTFSQEKDRLVSTYNNIGIIYEKISDYDKAMDYYRKAINLVTKDQLETKISLLLNIGAIHDLRDNLDSAEFYYLKVIELASKNEVKDVYLVSGAYSNLSIVYSKEDKLHQAKQIQLEGLKIEESMDLIRPLSYLNLANIYYEMGKLNDATIYAQKSLDLCRETGSKWTELAALDLLIKVNQEKGDSQATAKYAVYRSALKDTILTAENLEELRRLEVLHEVEKKDYENSLLESEIVIKSQKLNLISEKSKRQKIWGYFLIVALLGAVIILFVLYKKNKLKKELIQKERVLHEKETNEHLLKLQNERLEKENLKAQHDLANVRNQQLKLENDGIKRELVSNAFLTNEKNEILTKINELLDNSVGLKTIHEVRDIIKSNIENDTSWEVLKLHFDKVHPDFFVKLNSYLPNITQLEQKHCAYIKLKISNKEVARILNVELKSVQMAHYRLKKKLNLPENQTVRDFIDQL